MTQNPGQAYLGSANKENVPAQSHRTWPLVPDFPELVTNVTQNKQQGHAAHTGCNRSALVDEKWGTKGGKKGACDAIEKLTRSGWPGPRRRVALPYGPFSTCCTDSQQITAAALNLLSPVQMLLPCRCPRTKPSKYTTIFPYSLLRQLSGPYASKQLQRSCRMLTDDLNVGV